MHMRPNLYQRSAPFLLGVYHFWDLARMGKRGHKANCDTGDGPVEDVQICFWI